MTTRPPKTRLERRLLVALVVASLFHGGLLAAGSFRATYDAYVHLFFADHYARSWFSSWEPRWYTGFTTVSYPPASHQLLAIVSRFVGGGWAFVPVMLAAVVLLVVGVFRFARLWVGPRAAGYAALLAALSSSVAETVHVFGQLPTILSLGLLLNSLPFLHRWVQRGGVGWLVAGVLCTAATTAAHHVTTLFGSVFFLGPVLVHAILANFRQPLADEVEGHVPSVSRSTLWPLVARRVRRIVPALARAATAGVLVVVGLVTVVLPYWLWSSSDPITQIPIPHASRDSFVDNVNAGLVFWLVPWGVLLLLLPIALVRGFTGAAWPLAASVALLTLLGTGGTTPVPRLLLGGAFEILTLDRFTFWATIGVLPLAGAVVESAVHGGIRAVLTTQFGRRLAVVAPTTLAVAALVVAVLSANLARHRPFQPGPIDMDPIVEFLAKDDHERWRYLTLGFGDQMAWLSAQTTAESVDGNYHSARRLPELTSTPVERLEGAKYSGVPGLGSLQQFLAIPEKYHLKFVFSNDQFYDPLLSASGWQRLEPLENGIAVWQRDDVTPLPAGRLRVELPRWQRLLWGVLPLTAVTGASLVLLSWALGVDPDRWRPRPPRVVRVVGGRADAWLVVVAARVPAGGGRTRWHVLRDRLTGPGAWLRRPVSRRRRRLQTAAVVLAGCGLAVGLIVRTASPAGPSEVVFRYHDALDLRRRDVAYDLLDPALRPTRTQFVTELSVTNGLVASYARLDRIESVEVERRGDVAMVRSELVYVTALDEHPVVVVDRLRLAGGRWLLQPHDIDGSIPPDQLVARPSVGYVAQGRRQVTDGTTAYHDVVDRPEISIVSSRLVDRDGRLTVVGELRNDDVDPASLTVTAELVDENGAVLTTYHAATASVHTALPGETVPFRIDFEGVAGLVGPAADEITTEVVAFEPGARSPLSLEADRIAEVRVSAKALVTSLDLERTLVAQHVVIDDDRRTLAGELRNDGIEEVTVPHAFLVLRDERGEVGWVDHVFVSEAVRPQRSVAFDMMATAPDAVEPLDVPVRLYANGLAAPEDRARPATLTDVAGWSSADLVLRGFTR